MPGYCLERFCILSIIDFSDEVGQRMSKLSPEMRRTAQIYAQVHSLKLCSADGIVLGVKARNAARCAGNYFVEKNVSPKSAWDANCSKDMRGSENAQLASAWRKAENAAQCNYGVQDGSVWLEYID